MMKKCYEYLSKALFDEQGLIIVHHAAASKPICVNLRWTRWKEWVWTEFTPEFHSKMGHFELEFHSIFIDFLW